MLTDPQKAISKGKMKRCSVDRTTGSSNLLSYKSKIFENKGLTYNSTYGILRAVSENTVPK